MSMQTASPQLASENVSLDPDWAWQTYEPTAESPWDVDAAAHLYRRAAFGASRAQLDAALEAGPAATLEHLLAGTGDRPAFYTGAEQMAVPLVGGPNADGLPAWWLYVMRHSPHPLVEKMTLFWHNHFATSAAKVTRMPMMYAQNVLLREHALGKFSPLLHAAAKDPAMLVWLDAASNRKSKPNENFAREVMELFALGIGNYSEADIKEAARAFTGWEVRGSSFAFRSSQHDSGVKRLLGRQGRFDGDGVIDLLLAQPATARFLVGKLYREFISETAPPPEELIEPLAVEYRHRDYDTAWLVRAMLSSNLFFSPLARRMRIKSPVDLAIGLLRALELETNTYALADDLEAAGQAVFYPPNVKGWEGGTSWINASTLLARANLVWSLVGGADGRYKQRPDLDHLAGGARTPEAVAAAFVDLLLAAPLPAAVETQLAALAGDNSPKRLPRLVQAIATLPEFQLS